MKISSNRKHFLFGFVTAVVLFIIYILIVGALLPFSLYTTNNGLPPVYKVTYDYCIGIPIPVERAKGMHVSSESLCVGYVVNANESL